MDVDTLLAWGSLDNTAQREKRELRQILGPVCFALACFGHCLPGHVDRWVTSLRLDETYYGFAGRAISETRQVLTHIEDREKAKSTYLSWGLRVCMVTRHVMRHQEKP